MFRALRLTLITTLMFLSVFQSQPLGRVEATSYRSWVMVDVISFDGQGIVARVTLKTTGNHENASVYMYGDSSLGTVVEVVGIIFD